MKKQKYFDDYELVTDDADDAIGDFVNRVRGKSTAPKEYGDLDYLRHLLSSNQPIEITTHGELVPVDNSSVTPFDKPNQAGKKKRRIIPKAIVSSPSSQWYVKNRELYEAEVAAMREELGDPKLNPKFMSNGQMYWVVSTRPNLGPGFKTMKYRLLLVYDSDHPRVRYGTSIKVYPIDPSIDEMQDIINDLNIHPKEIPHTITDDHGRRYLCSADKRYVSASSKSYQGITSAVTSLRFAYRWLMLFELGLRDPKTWSKFQRHGFV